MAASRMQTTKIRATCSTIPSTFSGIDEPAVPSRVELRPFSWRRPGSLLLPRWRPPFGGPSSLGEHTFSLGEHMIDKEAMRLPCYVMPVLDAPWFVSFKLAYHVGIDKWMHQMPGCKWQKQRAYYRVPIEIA